MNTEKNTTEKLTVLRKQMLSETARARIADELQAYASFHAIASDVRVGEQSRSTKQVPTGTSWFSRLTNLSTKRMTAALIVLALVAGGSTSFAAESAVPGDVLYPVKIEVNENIKSAFAISTEAEAALQAEFLAERLAEAETLAARGDLDATAAAELEERIDAHMEEVTTLTAAAELDGSYDVAASVRAALEGSLRSSAVVLGGLNASVQGNYGAELVNHLLAIADTAATANAEATSTVATSTTVDESVSAIVHTSATDVTKAAQVLANTKSSLNTKVYAELAADLDTAVAAQADAEASLEADAYESAYAASQIAIRLAAEVTAMIESQTRLDMHTEMDIDVATDSLSELGVAVDHSEEASTTTKEEDVTTTTPLERQAAVEVETELEADLDTGVLNVRNRTSADGSAGLSL